MRIPFLLILLSLLTSCASFNKSYTEINLYSKQDSVKVYQDKGGDYSYTPTKLIVERSRAPLFLTLEKDSTQETIHIPSKLSLEFWIGNVFNGSFALGYLADYSNQKRFKYPSNVLLDIDNLNKIDYKFKPQETPIHSLNLYDPNAQAKKFIRKKGTIQLSMTIPEGNSFVINKGTHVGESFGFLGLTSQVSYYYKDSRFFGLGAGALLDFIIPFPAPYTVRGEYERSSGIYLELLQGFNTQRASFHYGLSISKYNYYNNGTEEAMLANLDDSFSVKENRMGLSLAANFFATHYFSFGIKYMPSFYTLQTNEFGYGHFLFLDLALHYKIRN